MWHDVKQNTEAWDELRLGKATGSKAGVWMANDGKAFGEPAKDYALQLALEIETGRKAEYSFTNGHMERGHEQEPIARMMYEAEYFATVTNGGFYDCGEYGDSPDGLVGADGIIEIKSVTAAIHYANLRRGAPDPAYKWQTASHIDCSGTRLWVDWCSYCSDFPAGRQLIVYRVTRDGIADQLERLRARRTAFLDLVRETLSTLRLAA